MTVTIWRYDDNYSDDDDAKKLILTLCLNDLLVGDLCKNFFYFHIFYFSLFKKMILSDTLIIPVSQLQTQRVMTSQIRSHIE